MNERRRPLPPAVALGILGLVLVGLVSAAVYGIRMLRPHGDSQHLADIGAAQEMVTTKLGPGGRFAPVEETSFELLDNGRAKVSGEVDMIAQSGSVARYFYTVLMRRSPDGQWVADDVSIVPI